MSDFDWEVTTWEGNRRAQRNAFSRLSFREKILELERLSDMAEALQKGRSKPPAIGPLEKR